MNIGVQQLIVALIMLVPGFIATNIQRMFAPRRFSSDLHWTVTSLLTSIMLNLLLAFAFTIFLFGKDALSIPIHKAASQFGTISIQTIFAYIILLYFSALFWGVISGAFPQLRFRSILNRLRIISFAESPSVWDRIFDVLRPPDRPVSWLRVNLEDGKTIVGHLRHSSEHIDKDAAFEIYLDKPHEWVDGQWKALGRDIVAEGADGVYLRLLPNQVAEFYFREGEWSHNKGVDTDTP